MLLVFTELMPKFEIQLKILMIQAKKTQSYVNLESPSHHSIIPLRNLSYFHHKESSLLQYSLPFHIDHSSHILFLVHHSIHHRTEPLDRTVNDINHNKHLALYRNLISLFHNPAHFSDHSCFAQVDTKAPKSLVTETQTNRQIDMAINPFHKLTANTAAYHIVCSDNLELRSRFFWA